MNEHSGMLLLDPANPQDFSPDELRELADCLEDAVDGIAAVPAPRDEEGYGGPLSEVVYIWLIWATMLDQVETATKTAELVQAAASWLRARWHRDHDEHGDRARKRVLVVCDEHGRVIAELEINLPDGTPVERNTVPDGKVPHGRPSPPA